MLWLMVIGYYSMVNKGRSIGNEYQCSMVSKWPMASLWQMLDSMNGQWSKDGQWSMENSSR